MAAAVGCVYTPTASLGVRGPIGGNTNIQPSAVVGGGVMASDGNKVLETSLDFDQAEDVDGPLAVNSDNLTLRVVGGVRRGKVTFKGGIWQRNESATVSVNGSTVANESQNLGGVEAGVSVEAGPVDVGIWAQKSLWGDSHPDAPTGAYGLSATYRF